MFASILTSCPAIMPQINIGGDLNMTLNGDGWVMALLLLMVLIAVTRIR